MNGFKDAGAIISNDSRLPQWRIGHLIRALDAPNRAMMDSARYAPRKSNTDSFDELTLITCTEAFPGETQSLVKDVSSCGCGICKTSNASAWMLNSWISAQRSMERSRETNLGQSKQTLLMNWRSDNGALGSEI